MTVVLSKEPDQDLFRMANDETFMFANTKEDNPFVPDYITVLNTIMERRYRDPTMSMEELVKVHMAILAAEFLFGKNSTSIIKNSQPILNVLRNDKKDPIISRYLKSFLEELIEAMRKLSYHSSQVWRIKLAEGIINAFIVKPEEP